MSSKEEECCQGSAEAWACLGSLPALPPSPPPPVLTLCKLLRNWPQSPCWSRAPGRSRAPMHQPCVDHPRENHDQHPLPLLPVSSRWQPGMVLRWAPRELLLCKLLRQDASYLLFQFSMEISLRPFPATNLDSNSGLSLPACMILKLTVSNPVSIRVMGEITCVWGIRTDVMKWHSTPVFLPAESYGWRSPMGCSP